LIDEVGSPSDDVQVIVALIKREIHYRLLQTGHGSSLRHLLNRENHASHIARAIATIRDDIAQPLTVADLARTADMSVSSFHEHFKVVTATTPLQFQKDLRLLSAHRLLIEHGRSVTEVAIDVGYQSPNQFSREYARRFGLAPRDDKTQSAPSVPILV
jgi:transcriptional regulator GlxA family with amidase domain